MKKYTIVNNVVYQDDNIKGKYMMVEYIEGEDMRDAMYRHWQKVWDEGYEVEDVIIFEGEHSFKQTSDFNGLTEQQTELV